MFVIREKFRVFRGSKFLPFIHYDTILQYSPNSKKMS